MTYEGLVAAIPAVLYWRTIQLLIRAWDKADPFDAMPWMFLASFSLLASNLFTGRVPVVAIIYLALSVVGARLGATTPAVASRPARP